MTDFADDWADVAPATDTRKSPFERTMEEASRIAVAKLIKEYPEGLSASPDGVPDLLSRVLATFLDTWYSELRRGDLATLVEHIIAGQDLEPSEVEGFVQALPRSFLEKVAKTSGKKMNGYHLLFSLELHRRDRVILGYSVGEEGGRKYVEFLHNDQRADIEPTRIREFLDAEWDDPDEQEEPSKLTDDEAFTAVVGHPVFRAMAQMDFTKVFRGK